MVQVVQLSLGIQNGSVVAAALGIVLLLLHPGAAPGGFGIFVTLVITVNAFGATGALAGLAMDVVVERDWYSSSNTSVSVEYYFQVLGCTDHAIQFA